MARFILEPTSFPPSSTPIDSVPSPSQDTFNIAFTEFNHEACQMDKAAKHIWDAFWEKREAVHKQMLKEETPAKQQTRQNRKKNKPTQSAKVFEWAYNVNELPEFV
ncbi:hypothetical protein AN958_08808 [Leucoagaricus sp. SymC.cos]|nr:hypothetical protein AN958_08808 [Leucoagaricus sp. SymC.cos]